MPTASSASAMTLVLDDQEVGSIASAEGGDLRADVVDSPTGSERFVRKHLGQVRYADIVVKLGLGLDESVYKWIAAAWSGESTRKSGAIVTADAAGKVRTHRKFQNAVISETRLPAFDGASKDAALLTLCLAPESVSYEKVSGSVRPKARRPKRWLGSNFRLEISGLDTSRIRRIEAFSIRSDPRRINFPDLTVHLAATRADSWREWLDDFVRKGENGPSGEKSGFLAFVTPDHKTELARIRLEGLGIYNLSDRAASAGAARMLTAAMYCERMHIEVKR